MKNRTRSFIMLAALAGGVTSASAQDPRMSKPKLDVASSNAINAVVDSARAQGLPYSTLLDKVNEGVAKGADGPHIVAVVRSLYSDMVVVRLALGAIATPDELKAGASAVKAGVSPVELGQLQKQSRLRSLVTPFTVAADLIARGVPVGTAVKAVKSLMGAGAKDKEINDFQRNVKDDIEQGAPPAAAAEARAKTTNGKPEKEKEKPDQMEQIKL